MKLFVSYSHAQGEWVRDRLVPCLEAGGATVFVDYRHFAPGHTVVGQMDIWQDRADRHVLVLSEDYCASTYCRHEMERAIAVDPSLASGAVLPIRLTDVTVPPQLAMLIYVDLRDDNRSDQWQLILDACNADLGASAPDWLGARDEIRRQLLDDHSVNLVVPDQGVKWRELIFDLESRSSLKFPRIDLDSGEAVSRRHLIETMLRRFSLHDRVPAPPADLPVLTRALRGVGRSRITLVHFDRVVGRPGYDENLHAALRHLVQDERKLVLLVQSRVPFSSLLPGWDLISEAFITTVQLRARK